MKCAIGRILFALTLAASTTVGPHSASAMPGDNIDPYPDPDPDPDPAPAPTGVWGCIWNNIECIQGALTVVPSCATCAAAVASGAVPAAVAACFVCLESLHNLESCPEAVRCVHQYGPSCRTSNDCIDATHRCCPDGKCGTELECSLSQAVCGDGYCGFPVESSTNCPQDCGYPCVAPPGVSCDDPPPPPPPPPGGGAGPTDAFGCFDYSEFTDGCTYSGRFCKTWGTHAWGCVDISCTFGGFSSWCGDIDTSLLAD